MKELLAPALTWAVRVATGGNETLLPVVTGPTKRMIRFFWAKLDVTLGKSGPTTTSPVQAAQGLGVDQMKELCAAMVQSMLETQQQAGQTPHDVLMVGVNTSFQLFQCQQSKKDSFGRFTSTHKAKICSWVGVLTWDEVPKIWHDIAATRNDDDLRIILEKYWRK